MPGTKLWLGSAFSKGPGSDFSKCPGPGSGSGL